MVRCCQRCIEVPGELPVEIVLVAGWSIVAGLGPHAIHGYVEDVRTEDVLRGIGYPFLVDQRLLEHLKRCSEPPVIDADQVRATVNVRESRSMQLKAQGRPERALKPLVARKQHMLEPAHKQLGLSGTHQP